VSFRPDAEEAKIIERTRRQLKLKTRADAIRHLIRRGAERRPLSEDPAFKMRFPELRRGRSLTSEEIDRELYGPRDDA